MFHFFLLNGFFSLWSVVFLKVDCIMCEWVCVCGELVNFIFARIVPSDWFYSFIFIGFASWLDENTWLFMCIKFDSIFFLLFFSLLPANKYINLRNLILLRRSGTINSNRKRAFGSSVHRQTLAARYALCLTSIRTDTQSHIHPYIHAKVIIIRIVIFLSFSIFFLSLFLFQTFVRFFFPFVWFLSTPFSLYNSQMCA